MAMQSFHLPSFFPDRFDSRGNTKYFTSARFFCCPAAPPGAHTTRRRFLGHDQPTPRTSSRTTPPNITTTINRPGCSTPFPLPHLATVPLGGHPRRSPVPAAHVHHGALRGGRGAAGGEAQGEKVIGGDRAGLGDAGSSLELGVFALELGVQAHVDVLASPHLKTVGFVSSRVERFKVERRTCSSSKQRPRKGIGV